LSRFFSVKLSQGPANVALLLLRLATGLLILTHGFPKLMHFNEMSAVFPDPLHVGSRISLMLTIFAELLCAVFIVIGLFTRLAVLPLIIEMAIILLVIHNHSSVNKQELDWHYLIAGLVILLCGPGRISVDGMGAR
jgi:putative oxidoreductase